GLFVLLLQPIALVAQPPERGEEAPELRAVGPLLGRRRQIFVDVRAGRLGGRIALGLEDLLPEGLQILPGDLEPARRLFDLGLERRGPLLEALVKDLLLELHPTLEVDLEGLD